jgi:transposase
VAEASISSTPADRGHRLEADMREWLPEDDLVFIVLDAVAMLALGAFRRRYRADEHGRAAFDPQMMVALLLYGYCRGERSSRVIEKRCVRDVGYRVMCGGLHPDHATIARFRACSSQPRPVHRSARLSMARARLTWVTRP